MTTLQQADDYASQAYAEYLRESTIGLAGAATYWYGEWAHWTQLATRLFDRYIRQARSLGTCTICETEGYQPWELDEAARCAVCQP